MGEPLTIKECYRILDNYKAPDIVIKHSEGVGKVCFLIAKKLIEKGEEIDLNSLIYASLLHDIFKIVEIKDYNVRSTPKEVEEKKEKWDEIRKKYPDGDHEELFFQVFKDKYPKISKIVLKHRYDGINEGFENWEERILYYADKLLMWDKITTLKERLEEAHTRYASKYPNTPENQKYIEDSDKKIFGLESEILKTAGISSEELIKLNDVDFREMIKEDFNDE